MLDSPCFGERCQTSGYPLHSPLSPSLPLPRASVCHQVSRPLYYPIPPSLDVPTSAARCLQARNDARDPSSERWNCVGENVPVILPKWKLPRHLEIFYMPQMYDMGTTALLPLRRKACWWFFRPEKSWRRRAALNPRTWVLKSSMLPLDHRSRWTAVGRQT